MKKTTLFFITLGTVSILLGGCDTPATTNGTAPGTDPQNKMEATAPNNPTAEKQVLNEEEQKMLDIALKDAGIKEEDLTNLKVTQDTEGKTPVYDVDFTSGTMEYDYEIEIATGKILSKDSEVNDDATPDKSVDTSKILSKEEVAKIVLPKVPGATEKDLHMTLEDDDGHKLYEGEIRFGEFEYEFELNAHTGDFIQWHQEGKDE